MNAQVLEPAIKACLARHVPPGVASLLFAEFHLARRQRFEVASQLGELLLDALGRIRANLLPSSALRARGASLMRRRLPPIGLAWDLASDVDVLVVREAPCRYSETHGQDHSCHQQKHR